MLTVKQAADKLGVSRRAVRAALGRGTLAGERSGTGERASWLVSPDSLERYAQRRAERGADGAGGPGQPSAAKPEQASESERLWQAAADSVALIGHADDLRAATAAALRAIARAACSDAQARPGANAAVTALKASIPLTERPSSTLRLDRSPTERRLLDSCGYLRAADMAAAQLLGN